MGSKDVPGIGEALSGSSAESVGRIEDWGGHRQTHSVRVCSPPSRRVAPLRGAHGLDAGSAHAHPGSCLTMTRPDSRYRGPTTPFGRTETRPRRQKRIPFPGIRDNWCCSSQATREAQKGGAARVSRPDWGSLVRVQRVGATPGLWQLCWGASQDRYSLLKHLDRCDGDQGADGHNRAGAGCVSWGLELQTGPSMKLETLYRSLS